jgi:SAM-dependent methyltransferase
MSDAATELWTYEAESAPCVCGGFETGRVMQCRDEGSGLPFRYVQCPQCGIDRLDPRPKAADAQRFYPTAYYAHQSDYGAGESGRRQFERLIVRTFYARSHRDPALVRWPLKLLLWPLRRWPVLAFPEPNSKSVYEFGAAAGSDLMKFRDAGWQTAGSEPSSQACSVARSRGLDLECATAEEARLAPNDYDCVLLNNVFEHLYDPVKALTKIHAGLRPDGRLILIVPNHDSWAARWLRGNWAGADAPRHIYGYSPRTLAKLLNDHGFDIEYVSHRPATGWAWRWAAHRWLAARAWNATSLRLAGHAFAVLMIPVAVGSAAFRHADFIKVVAKKSRDDDESAAPRRPARAP